MISLGGTTGWCLIHHRLTGNIRGMCRYIGFYLSSPKLHSMIWVHGIEAANILYLFCVYVCIFARDWFHILDQQMLSQGKCPCLLTRITRHPTKQNRKEIHFSGKTSLFSLKIATSQNGPNVEYRKTLEITVLWVIALWSGTFFFLWRQTQLTEAISSGF